MDFSRRNFLSTAAALPFAMREPGTREPRAPEPAITEPATVVPDAFPMQRPDMVREMVIVSHGNVKRVRELVEAHPALARAAIDWGFGDWEDALGAASHVGNREIAEYLISRGARPTVFSAAMLGQLDAVKAFIAASPGVQRIAGPHSISLLSHARAGRDAAKPVYDYLEQLGEAGGPKTEPITDEEKNALTGTYVFGSGSSDRIAITIDNGALMLNRPGMPFPRGLLHVGDRVFYPMGAAAVRITFTPTAISIQDGEIAVSATKSM